MNVGCDDRATLTLGLPRLAVVPHVELAGKHAAALESLHERNFTGRPDDGRVGGHRCHREAAASSGDRVRFVGVRLLPSEQIIQSGLPLRAIDDGRVCGWSDRPGR